MRVFLLSCFLFLLITAVSAQKTGQALVDSILHELPSMKEDTNKVKAFIKIAQNYLFTDPAKGFAYVKNGQQLAEKINWKRGIANLYNTQGLLVGDTGNNSLARTYFEKSLVINEQFRLSHNTISNLNNIGRTYQRESDYAKALDYFTRALSVAQESNDNEQIALVGTNLITSYYAQKNYLKALDYAEMTLKYGTLSHTPNNVGKALLDIGIIKAETKDTMSAKAYMNRALMVYQEIGNESAIAGVLVEKAALEYPDIPKALEQMNRAQSILDRIAPSSMSSIGNLANLGSYYYELSQTSSSKNKKLLEDSAMASLNRGIRMAKETGNVELLATMSLNLSKIMEGHGDYKSALDHFKTYYTINDSLFSQDKKNELATLASRQQMDIKNKEILLSNMKLINQRKTLIALVVGLALLGIIGVLLFWQNRIRKKTNTTLMVLNNQLDEANKIKLKFFGILSHDLRSPVSNLVNYLHLIKNEPDLLSNEERIIHQQQIGESTHELLQTLETMLLWSKEQMEHFKPDIKLVPVNELFEYLQKFFVQVQPVRIQFINEDQLHVSADENYLKVIMQNLTSNAIKALANTNQPVITWRAYAKGGETILSITDNGAGIQEEQAKALFSETAGYNSSIGFGFHLIRDLSKAIHYTIAIESQPGMGTTFILSS